jgi:LPXTG-motif cell wall-anchored protein
LSQHSEVTVRLRPIVGIGSALLAVLAAVILFPAAASAHTNSVAGVSACAADGTYTVTWTVTNNWSTGETASLNSSTGGGTITGLPATLTKSGGATPTATVTQAGIPGTATSASLAVHGVWSDFSTDDSGSVTLGGDCTQHVTPAAPTATPATCAAPNAGAIVIPAGQTGVVYHLTDANGPVLAAGANPEPVGSYTIVAVPASPAYTLDGATSWTGIGVAAPTDCVTAAAASFDSAVCSAGSPVTGTLTVPDSANVTYFISGGTVSGGTVSATSVGAGIPTANAPQSIAPGTYAVAPGLSIEISATADADYGLAGDQGPWDYTYPAAAPCTVVQPSATPQSCDTSSSVLTPATLTVTASPGVAYQLDSAPISGTVEIAPGEHTVTATALAGYSLAGYPAGGWTVEVSAVPCAAPTTSTPSPAPSSSAPAAVTVATPSLPNTGSPDRQLLVLGAILLLAGAGLLVGTRIRSRSQR